MRNISMVLFMVSPGASKGQDGVCCVAPAALGIEEMVVKFCLFTDLLLAFPMPASLPHGLSASMFPGQVSCRSLWPAWSSL